MPDLEEGTVYSDPVITGCDGTTASGGLTGGSYELTYELGDCADSSGTRTARITLYTTDTTGALTFDESVVSVTCGEMPTMFEATWDFDSVEIKKHDYTIGSAPLEFSILEFVDEAFSELIGDVSVRHSGEPVFLTIGRFGNDSSSVTTLMPVGLQWAPIQCQIQFEGEEAYVFFDIMDGIVRHPGLDFQMWVDNAKEIWAMKFNMFKTSDASSVGRLTCKIKVCSIDIDEENPECEAVQNEFMGEIKVGGATGVIFVG